MPVGSAEGESEEAMPAPAPAPAPEQSGASSSSDTGAGRDPASSAGAGAGTIEPLVRASRIFSGPGQYPPGEFAAYGILAFQEEASSATMDRYLAICRGYITGLTSSGEMEDGYSIPLRDQMATVWPLDDSITAGILNGFSSRDLERDGCYSAIYDLNVIESRRAIARARNAISSFSFSGRGPFLIAWSPASTVGSEDVPVLVWNLSNVTNTAQATGMFREWADEIERDPSLWRNGWNLNGLRIKLQLWSDRYGPGVLQLLGGVSES